MIEADDHALLAEYSGTGSEAAFRAVVERYVNLVYSAALRVTRNSQDAEEVTQAVFVVLARKAGSLRRETVLPGWLYQTAGHAAANLVRGKIRRQRREQEACMQSISNEPDDEAWKQLAPQLEDAMGLLGEKDRNAVVLRFFQNKSNREVGAALKVTEGAAHQRVSRALEKLRSIFAKRGLTLSAAAIGAALSANSVQAAPAGLAGVALAAAGGTASGASVAMLAGEVLRRMKWWKIQSGVVAGACILAATVLIGLVLAKRPPASATRTVSAEPPSTTARASSPQMFLPVTNYNAVQVEPTTGFDIHIAALNNRGQLVGSLDSTNYETHSFIWDDGVITDLGTLGGSKSLATGVNDAGDIAGLLLTNGARHVFLRHNGGEVSDLGILDHFAKLGDEGDKYKGGPEIIYYAPRVAINGHAQVTGRLMDERDNPHSFLFDQGRTSFFGLIGDGNRFEAEAINVRGQILGRATQGTGPMRSMLWQNGELIDLGSLEGTSSGAAAINDRGTVVGSLRFTNGTSQAFAWENGHVKRLTLGKNKSASASSINNAGVVVGAARTMEKRSYACLWTGEEIVDLNEMVKLEPGWRLTSADKINDRGQILAWATDGRRYRDYLLSPPKLRPLLEEPTPVAPRIVASVEPFNLSSFERLPNGAFRLAFAGSSDAAYVIEASTNLVDWVVLGPAANNGGKVEFTDEEAVHFALRFYRAARKL